jgi:hypothetical protein
MKMGSVEELAHECGRFHDYPFHLEGQSLDAVQRIILVGFVDFGVGLVED